MLIKIKNLSWWDYNNNLPFISYNYFWTLVNYFWSNFTLKLSKSFRWNERNRLLKSVILREIRLYVYSPNLQLAIITNYWIIVIKYWNCVCLQLCLKLIWSKLRLSCLFFFLYRLMRINIYASRTGWVGCVGLSNQNKTYKKM